MTLLIIRSISGCLYFLPLDFYRFIDVLPAEVLLQNPFPKSFIISLSFCCCYLYYLYWCLEVV